MPPYDKLDRSAQLAPKKPAKNGGQGVLQGAISGFGAMAARAHLPGWQSRNGVSIVAVHDPVRERRENAIYLIRNVRVYDDLAQMLRNETLDFVDIVSPPDGHASAARLALRAGVNVIVEKPLCLTAAEFQELINLGRRYRRLILCVHNWKYSPVYRRVHELIGAGVVGRVQYLSLVRMRSEPAATSSSGAGWRLSSAAGGGILIDHGWHCFYLAHWLLNGDRPMAVSSYFQFHRQSGVDDLADLRISFRDNRLVNVLLTWNAPVRRTGALVVGSTGVVEVEDNKIRVGRASGRSVEYSVSEASDDSYHPGWFASAAADFERVLKEGPDAEFARVNLAEAATALALTIAARKSAARDGALITVDPVE